VVDLVLAFGGAGERRRIAQIAGYHPDAERLEGLRLPGRARQHGHLVAPAAEGFGQVTADEAGRAGDQRLHR
jgi:hypothetical protein